MPRNSKKRASSCEDLSPSLKTAIKKAKSANNRKLAIPKSKTDQSSSTPLPVDDFEMKDTPTPPEKVETQTPAVESKITSKPTKPIFVTSSLEIVRRTLEPMKLKIPPLIKRNSKTETSISCFTAEDKAKILQRLTFKAIHHFTYTETVEKPLIAVLKGLHRLDTVELNTMLERENIQAEKVSFLIDNEDYPVYLVHFKSSSITINQLQRNHKTIGNIIVRWEKLNRLKKRVTQCFNCQAWGHSSRNCGRPRKCVKCTETHDVGQCKRVNKEAEGSPKCVNCQGEHAASHRQCPVYKTYEQRLATNRNRRSRQPIPTTAHFVEDDFPALPAQRPHQQQHVNTSSNVNPSVSFAQAARLSRPPLRSQNRIANSTPNLAATQAKFLAIPNITETLTLFAEMTEELSLATDQGARLLILLKYTSPNNGV